MPPLSSPSLWRSLAELAAPQAPAVAPTRGLDRREFLASLGASVTALSVAACSRPSQGQLVPYVHAPAGQIDGMPRWFATTLTREGYAHGVLVESNMGRPTKVEGNPGHPASLGATDIFDQASVLQLWDPDRSQGVRHGVDAAAWDDFAAAWLRLAAALERDGGTRLRLLTGTVTSPTLAAQIEALRRRFPQSRWHVHQPAAHGALAGAALACGTPLSVRLHLQRAQVVLALDADFLGDAAAGVRYARDFAAARAGAADARTRLYALEATPSLTGAMADHRLPLESARIEEFARALAARLGVAVPGAPRAQPRWLDAVASELSAHRGAALVVIGAAQPPWMHALGLALNAALGALGTTLSLSDPVEALPGADGDIAALAADLHGGRVDTLVVLDCNPLYDAPAELDFAGALRRVPHLVHLGLYRDETGVAAEWHLPQAHALEAWSDARAYDGTVSLAQPLIAPLYGGRSAHELLAALLGDALTEGHALVRRQWRAQLDEARWNDALEAGVVAGSALPARTPALRQFTLPPVTADAGPELLFRPDPTVGDGRWANNGWLQELPKPLTQLTWDNPLLVSVALAQSLALANGDLVDIECRGRTLRAAVWIMPGQAPQSLTLHLGYGRRRAGRLGEGRGFDAYALRPAADPWRAQPVRITRAPGHYPLAGTQQHFAMQGSGLVRVATVTGDPASARAAPQPVPPSLYPDYPPGEYAWGMSIDLDACIGCKACTIACQAENNIPVVGKEEVGRGREMHWIRVDVYHEGAAANPRTYAQPVPCMMCEHAPCELVCPVEATVHDAEGLNLQVYNRCVGTRFCSNNCPYKVRRFNFRKYTDDAETLKAQRNPEVSVRRRGVMEKCTYCIQRIERAHIAADIGGRRIADGEVVTACQAVCPTQAIRFGDTADAHSAVSAAKRAARNYVLLAELNTRPRTSYLARLRNPNPALEEEG